MVQLDLTYLSGTSDCNFAGVDGANALLQASVRQVLMDMAKSNTYSLSVYKETLRSLINIFSRYSIVDGEGKVKEVPAIYARPERAIAKATSETKNLVLPIISVYQSGVKSAQERGRYSPVLIHDKYWDTKAARAVRILSFAPRPVNLIYQVSIWTKYREDLDQLSEQITFAFNPSMEIPTTKSTLAKGYILDEIDLSPNDTADAQDRLLRKAFTIQVETYIESPRFLYTSTGKIEQIKADFDFC